MRSLSVLILATSLISCDLCGNDLIEDVASPDGKHIASVFERGCGVPSPLITVMSLRKSNANFVPEEFSDWVFSLEGRSVIKIVWVANDRMKVSFTGIGEAPTRQERKWNDIVIDYH